MTRSHTQVVSVRRRLRALALPLALAGLFLAVLAGPAFAASVQDIGTLPGGTSSGASAVDDSGQVVGYSDLGNGGVHAFLWAEGGGMFDLGTFPDAPFEFSVATGVSHPSGVVQVVGYAATDTGVLHAFSWTEDGGMVDLGTLPGVGNGYSSATGVNDSGQVVGVSETSSGASHAFLWTDTDGMVDLGTLPGAQIDQSEATSINDSGQVAGRSWTSSGKQHAFSWTQGEGMTDLGALLGNSFANGINEAGEVVGYAEVGVDVGGASGAGTRAFSFRKEVGVMVNIGALSAPPFDYSNATGVNDSRQIVGVSGTSTGSLHGFS
jgi:probable HAF family extracellular repeat protein